MASSERKRYKSVNSTDSEYKNNNSTVPAAATDEDSRFEFVDDFAETDGDCCPTNCAMLRRGLIQRRRQHTSLSMLQSYNAICYRETDLYVYNIAIR